MKKIAIHSIAVFILVVIISCAGSGGGLPPDDDGDDDGFLASEDCNDDDPLINPDVVEVPNNDVDENCDPADDDSTTEIVSTDDDGDGEESSEANNELTDDEKFMLNYVNKTGEISTGYLEAYINYDTDVYSSPDDIEDLPAIGHVSDKTIILYCGEGRQTPASADIVTKCSLGNGNTYKLYWWCNESGGSVGYSYDGGTVYTHGFPDGQTFGYLSCNDTTSLSYGFVNSNEFYDVIGDIEEAVSNDGQVETGGTGCYGGGLNFCGSTIAHGIFIDNGGTGGVTWDDTYVEY